MIQAKAAPAKKAAVATELAKDEGAGDDDEEEKRPATDEIDDGNE